MFVNLYAVVIGLTGACWRLAMAESTAPSPIEFQLPGRSWPRRVEI
jgi:hypothetical protein